MNPFEKALDLFGDDGRGWTQHTAMRQFPDGQKAYCAAAALAAACRIIDSAHAAQFGPAADILRRHTNHPLIPCWNDASSTTFEDVRLAFKHSAADWEDET